MPTFKIPNQGNIRQLNLGDTYGEIWASRNIDLHSNPGKIKLARPMKVVATASQLGSLQLRGFASITDSSGNTVAYAITSSALYSASYPYTSWNQIVADGFLVPLAVSRAEDIAVFQGQLIMNSATDLDAYNPSGTGTWTASWWTARGNPALTTNNPNSTVPRVLEVIRLGTEELVVLDGSNIYGYIGGITSGAVTSVTLDIDPTMRATCVKGGIRSAWIGTYATGDSDAHVFQWDGASTNYSQSYPTGAKAVLAMEMDDDVPVIITERGEIKKFNNVGFTTIARFPFADKVEFPIQSFQPANRVRPIQPKGVKRIGRNLFINVRWGNQSVPIDERTPDGTWVCNLDTGSLTHLSSTDNYNIFENSSPILYLDSDAGRILTGFQEASGTNQYSIAIEDLGTTTNYGYLVTSELETDDAKDAWESLLTKALLETDNEIEVKYRGSRVEDYPITIQGVEWDTPQDNVFFTSNSQMATVKARFDAGYSDEIEVLYGQSAGRLAHITNISLNAGTYTVTIDETIGIDGQTSTIRIDNWQKVPKTMTTDSGQVEKFGIDKTSDWTQYKIYFKGSSGMPEIRELSIKSNPKEKQ